jgi:hypothetical protein
MPRSTSRRAFLLSASLATAALTTPHLCIPRALADSPPSVPEEFSYGAVSLASETCCG